MSVTIDDAERAFYQEVLGNPDGNWTIQDLRFAYYLSALDGAVPILNPEDLEDGNVPVWNADDGKWEPGEGGGGSAPEVVEGPGGKVDTSGTSVEVTTSEDGFFVYATQGTINLSALNGGSVIEATSFEGLFNMIRLGVDQSEVIFSERTGLSIPTSAPDSPVSGAIWVDGGSLYYRSGTTTYKVDGVAQ